METKGKYIKLNTSEIEENKKKFFERVSLYRDYGYDQVKSRKSIIQKAGPIKGKILEIGTGKGSLTALLAKKAENIITVDISKEEQKFAALNAAAEGVLDRIRFNVCDAAKLPYSENKFDLVISSNAFHHFEYPFAVLKEMIRVCGGKLVVADFNKEGFGIVRKIHRDEGREHEEKRGNFDIVGVYLKEHGFSVKRFEEHCHLVYVAKKKGRR
ncbi:MAG: class I SAM-dependent methyltransferase [Candidatus Margulisiibacteriota bacterium]|nr:class I SAM-dependent methyltransferase [Candidatus Margulisiibacteriota bacterium]